jgi:hypothetical protein
VLQGFGGGTLSLHEVDRWSIRRSPVQPLLLTSTLWPSLLQGSLSALQASLVACGQLVASDLQGNQKMESKIRQSLLKDGIRQSRQHAEMLLAMSPNAKPAVSTRAGSSRSSSISSKMKSSTLVGRRKDAFRDKPIKGSLLEHDSPSRLPGRSHLLREDEDEDSYSTRSKKSSNLRPRQQSQEQSSYEGSLAAHLHTETKDTSCNPFRLRERSSKIHLSAAKSLSTLKSRQVDPKSYSNDSVTTHYGAYAVSVKEPYVTGVPSVDAVNKALVQLSRRMIVCYDTKVVETGAALKV